MSYYRFFFTLLISILWLGYETYAQLPMPRLSSEEQSNFARDILVTNDKRFFIICGEDRTIQIRDVTTGALIERIDADISMNKKGILYAADLSHDEKWLAVGGILQEVNEPYGQIRIYDWKQRTPIAYLEGHSRGLHCLKFTQDDRYLVSGSSDNTIRVWDTRTWECVSIKKGHKEYVYDLVLLDGYIFSVSFDSKLYKWDLHKSSPIDSFDAKRYLHAIASNQHKGLLAVLQGNYIALLNSNLQVLDTAWFKDDAGAIKFSDDGDLLLVGYWGGAEHQSMLYEIKNSTFGRRLYLGSQFRSTNAAAFIGNNRFIYSVSQRGYVYAEVGTNADDIELNILRHHVWKKYESGAPHWKGNQIRLLRFDYGGGKVRDTVTINTEALQVAFHKNINLDKSFQYDNYYQEIFYRQRDEDCHAIILRDSIKGFVGNRFSTDPTTGWNPTIINPFKEKSYFIGLTGEAVICDIDGRTYGRLDNLRDNVTFNQLSKDKNWLITIGQDQLIYLYNANSIPDTLGSNPHGLPPLDSIFSFNPEFERAKVIPEVQKLLSCPAPACWDSILSILYKTDSMGFCQLRAQLKFQRYFYTSALIPPLLTCYIADNSEWIMYTDEGFFVSSTGGTDLMYWHLNQGKLKNALTLPASSFLETYFRPDIIQRVLAEQRPAAEILKELGEDLVSVEEALKTSPTIHLDIDTTATTEHATVTVKASWHIKAPLKELVLKLNGRPVPQTMVQDISQPETNSVVYQYKVPLVPGSNSFSAEATNQASIKSVPAFAQVSGPEAKTNQRLFVLSIGINEYANTDLNLGLAVKDAMALQQEFAGRFIHQFSNIYTSTLLDEHATKQAIIDTLAAIAKRMNPGDAFVMTYAGHAITTSGSITELPEFYMGTNQLTSLSEKDPQLKENGISSAELKDMLAALPPSNQLVLLDACQSAGAALAFKRDRTLTELSQKTGTIIFTATHTGEMAYEYGKLGHGVFTHCLLEGLRGSADEAENSITDQKVTAYELIDYVKDHLPEVLARFGDSGQRPVSFKAGPDFVLTLK